MCKWAIRMFLWCTLVMVFQSAIGYEYNVAASINTIEYSKMFQNRIYKGKQLQILDSIKNGNQLSLDHCKKQFEWDRWNCPDSDFSRQFWKTTVTREAAYSAAIVAAGVAYSITKNCTQGIIPDCKCNSKFYKSQSNNDKWIVKGCTDDTSFSINLTKNLFKSLYINSDDNIAKASLHNHLIGIAAVQSTLKLSCKCHGLSGSCSVKSCSKHLAPFKEIAAFLKKRYTKAIRIQWNSVKRTQWSKIPKRKLVFFVDSPDYCRINNTTGWIGTSGRICSQTETDNTIHHKVNNCERLCLSCGHTIGHKSRIHKWRCNCKFHWCCKVTCETCSTIIDEYYCKATKKSL